MTVRFGTNDVRDLSGGVFPVEVWRCDRCVVHQAGQQPREHLSQRYAARVRTEAGLARALREACRGSLAGALEQWVELRLERQTQVPLPQETSND